MGRFGHYVIDADGHGGEPLGWRRRIPDEFKPQMRQYVAQMKAKYKGLPGGGMQINEKNPRQESRPDDDLDFDVPMREGMYDPVARIDDMDLEGIDVTIMFPPGSGEEWALSDAKFSAAVCRVMNDARAEYASHCPERLKLVAKLPMIDPELAAEELAALRREEQVLRRHWCRRPTSATRISTIPPSTSSGGPPSGSASRSARTAAARRPGRRPS